MAAIFLVGARAAGKTTVGLELARLLDCAFVDTDRHLRERLGRSVAEVVSAEGWPGFRVRESAALREVAAQHARGGAVIATGGGMVLDPENRRFMRAQGTPGPRPPGRAAPFPDRAGHRRRNAKSSGRAPFSL